MLCLLLKKRKLSAQLSKRAGVPTSLPTPTGVKLTFQKTGSSVGCLNLCFSLRSSVVEFLRTKSHLSPKHQKHFHKNILLPQCSPLLLTPPPPGSLILSTLLRSHLFWEHSVALTPTKTARHPPKHSHNTPSVSPSRHWHTELGHFPCLFPRNTSSLRSGSMKGSLVSSQPPWHGRHTTARESRKIFHLSSPLFTFYLFICLSVCLFEKQGRKFQMQCN